jgi:hypothetical protein
MSRGSSRCSSSTTSPKLCVWVSQHVTRLVVDFFAYAARPGASARRAARRRLLRLAQVRRRLLRLRRASGCLGTSRGSSRRSSSTSPTSRVRVPRHVARLVVNHSVRRDFVSRLDYSVHRHSTCCPVALALLQSCRGSRLLVSRQHRLYFEYATATATSSSGRIASTSHLD